MPKNRKFLKMFRKNLCDKVSKMKNLRLLSSSFFRADRCGVLCFFSQRIFHRENCKTKSPVFPFLKKSKKRRKVGSFLTPYTVQNIFGSYRLVIPNLIWARTTSKIIHFLHFNTCTNLELLKKSDNVGMFIPSWSWWPICVVNI